MGAGGGAGGGRREKNWEEWEGGREKKDNFMHLKGTQLQET